MPDAHRERDQSPTGAGTDEGAFEGLTYRDAGVNIDAGDDVVAGIRSLTSSHVDPRIIGGLGHFGGFFRLGKQDERTALVASIDGVGTKILVAQLADRHDMIGIDLVHHCVNDILACGAEPLFFLDYFGTGRLDPDAALAVIGGIASACRDLGIALLGGETAEMPGLYHGNDYDLVGAIVGLVHEHRIIDGSSIRAGDVILGIPSSGFHTNGYSLVRAALGLNEREAARERLASPAAFDASQTLADALLQPHRSYRQEVSAMLDTGAPQGMAHITGGGIPGNVARIIPDGLTAAIDVRSWDVPALFEYVAEAGHVDRAECFRAFNMGIGYVVICRPADVDSVRAAASDAIVIGEVTEARASGRVELIGLDDVDQRG